MSLDATQAAVVGTGGPVRMDMLHPLFNALAGETECEQDGQKSLSGGFQRTPSPEKYGAEGPGHHSWPDAS